jgi:ceramide glucosyltransferase
MIQMQSLVHDGAWWSVCLIALWPALELWRQTLAWRALRAMPPTPARTPPVAGADSGDDDASAASWFAGIDVLQPIRSGDVGLGEALAASLRELGARGAQLHWSIDEDDIVAGNVVRALLQTEASLAPQVAVSVHPSCAPGINPKLFKLDRTLAQCAGATVLVLDDDAYLPAATLAALLGALAGDCAESPVVATALPAYLPAPGLAARLLARFVNDNAALTYLPPRLGGGAPTLNGMCWVMQRESLLRIGGFAPWLPHLTDDLAMAQAVLRAGGRIEQRSEPVWLRTALPDFPAYRRQMHRWMLFAQLLLSSQPWPMRMRILLGHALPVPLPLLVLAVFAYAPSWLGFASLALGAALHVVGRKRLQRACAGAASAKAEPLLSLLSALLLPLHALHALIDRRIRWRTRRYRVYANDRFVDCE